MTKDVNANISLFCVYTILFILSYSLLIGQTPQFESLFLNGSRCLDERKFDSSIYYFSSSILIDSLHVDSYLNRGIVYYLSKDPQSAIKDFNVVIRLDSKVLEAYYNRGLAYFLAEQDSLALLDYNLIITKDPNFYQAYNARGKLYFKKRDFQKAEIDFNRAIDLSPNYADAYANRCELKTFDRKYKLALSDCNRAIESSNNEPWYFEIRGKVRLSLKDYQGAVEDFTKVIELDSHKIVVYPFLIESLNKSKNYIYLNDVYNRLIKINPDVSEWYLSRGEIFLRDNNIQCACQDFRMANEKLELEADEYTRGELRKKIDRYLRDCR